MPRSSDPNDRVLESELHAILERTAKRDVVEFATVAAKVRRELGNRHHTDSAALIAEDRLSH